MHTDEGASALLIALEPPGNIARDIALFRRQLFGRLGEASALAFPEIVPLAFALPLARRLSTGELESCWDGLSGAFDSSGVIDSRGLIYLSLDGPLDELRRRATEAFRSAGLQPWNDAPLETGVGFFVCRCADPALGREESARIGVPRAGFRDCSLVYFGLRFARGPAPGFEARPFSALSWREFARAKRPSRAMIRR